VAWTVVAANIHSQIAAVRKRGYPLHAARKVPASINAIFRLGRPTSTV